MSKDFCTGGAMTKLIDWKNDSRETAMGCYDAVCRILERQAEYTYDGDMHEDLYQVIKETVLKEAKAWDHEAVADAAYANGLKEGERQAERRMNNTYGEKIIAEYDRGVQHGIAIGRKDAEYAFRKIITPEG